jgi:hypothetical protein
MTAEARSATRADPVKGKFGRVNENGSYTADGRVSACERPRGSRKL